MTSIMKGFYSVLVDARQDFFETTNDVKTGAMWLADGTSRCLYDLVNIEKNGLLITLKFTMSAFKMASISYSTLFNGVNKDLEVLFTLYQSRSILNANVELLRFRNLTLTKILFAVVSYVSFFQFLKKTGVISISEVSTISHEADPLKMYNLIISRPREISVVIISLLDIYSTLPKIRDTSLRQFASDLYQSVDLILLLRLASNIGRISSLLLTLACFGKYTYEEKILGMISSSASLIRYLLLCSKEREARLYAPEFTARLS